jgi:hypothetical protein
MLKRPDMHAHAYRGVQRDTRAAHPPNGSLHSRLGVLGVAARRSALGARQSVRRRPYLQLHEPPRALDHDKEMAVERSRRSDRRRTSVLSGALLQCSPRAMFVLNLAIAVKEGTHGFAAPTAVRGERMGWLSAEGNEDDERNG